MRYKHTSLGGACKEASREADPLSPSAFAFLPHLVQDTALDGWMPHLVQDTAQRRMDGRLLTTMGIKDTADDGAIRKPGGAWSLMVLAWKLQP